MMKRSSSPEWLIEELPRIFVEENRPGLLERDAVLGEIQARLVGIPFEVDHTYSVITKSASSTTGAECPPFTNSDAPEIDPPLEWAHTPGYRLSPSCPDTSPRLTWVSADGLKTPTIASD